IGCQGVRRTRKLCSAQQISITRSRTPSFHRRIRSLSRVGTVDPCRYGVSPSPNRTYTFRRIRLSILEFLLSVDFGNCPQLIACSCGQHSHVLPVDDEGL